MTQQQILTLGLYGVALVCAFLAFKYWVIQALIVVPYLIASHGKEHANVIPMPSSSGLAFHLLPDLR